MNVRTFARRNDAPAPEADLIRKTRLMSKSGAMLVRVEIVREGTLRSTHFTVSTVTTSQSFTRMNKALAAFRALTRPASETVRLKAA